MESGLLPGPTTSTYHVLCSSRGERTRGFSSVFKRLTLPQTLIVEKTKLLILSFKIRHLCFSQKLLKPTVPRCLKQCLRRPHPACQAGPVVSTSRAGCTALRLPTGLDWESQEAMQTPSTVRGGLSPEALGSQMPPEPLPPSPQWAQSQDTHLFSHRIPVVSQALISKDKPVFLPLKWKRKADSATT